MSAARQPGAPTGLSRRAEYTQSFNRSAGRHGWLRLTPAYSVRIVEELLQAAPPKSRVLDPFCGTATTALSAAYCGHTATTADINPFLVWLARAKVAYYSEADLARARDACSHAASLATRETAAPAPAPPIHNPERWWHGACLRSLCFLKGAIDSTAPPGSPERTLLYVAFCRIVIRLSNAAFNHQSMSFRQEAGMLDLGPGPSAASLLRGELQFIARGAEANPLGACTVIQADARDLAVVPRGSVDLIITSPPYANRMSYVRELRPYMYWLGFLRSGRAAGDLDWASIGGTWGIATSRLARWAPSRSGYQSKLLQGVLARVAHRDNANGKLLANYIAKYFEDIWDHLRALPAILAHGAQVHYVIGNSAFYGVLLPTEAVYSEMLRELGFRGVRTQPVRKRNSKRELVEFDVAAEWR